MTNLKSLRIRLSLQPLILGDPQGGSPIAGATILVTPVLDAVPIGSVVAEFSVPGGAGTFTYSFTSNPGNLFSLDVNQLVVADVLSIGNITLGIQATNGVLTLDQNFTFEVIEVSTSFVVGARAFLPSSPVNKTLAEWVPVLQTWPMDMPPGNTTHPPNGFQNYFPGIKFKINCQPPDTSPIVSFIAPASWGWPNANINEPMTVGFSGNGDPPDNEGIYITADCTFQSLYNFTRTSDTSATCSDYALCNGLTDTGFGNPITGVSAGTVGVGISNYLGLLLKQEALKGAINHFLVMALLGNTQTPNLANAGFYTPAVAGDGSSSNGVAQEGQMLTIPQGTAMPGGLSQWGPILFATIQNYGIMVNDSGGSMGLYMAVDYADPANSWTSGDAAEIISDFNILGPMLYKVGCYLDGIQNAVGPQFQCGPRLALLSYIGHVITGTITSGGSGYQTSSTFTNVTLGAGNGGLGRLAAATISTNSSGAVISVTITSPGFNYSVGDVLTASVNSIGIFGSGFKWTVTGINTPICLTVRRDSDSASLAIGYVNGFLDTTSLVAFCNGTVGRVIDYNDSVGNFNPAAPTGTAPIIYQSGALVTMGGKPAMLFDGSTNVLKVPSSTAINPVPNGELFYFCTTVQISNYAGNYGIFGSDVTGGLEVRIETTTGYVQILLNNGTSIGASTTAVALNAPTCIEVTYNPQIGDFVIFQNRAQTASGTNLQSISTGNVLIGAGGTGVDLFSGLIGDALIGSCPSDPFPNISQFTINAGAQQYWGTA